MFTIPDKGEGANDVQSIFFQEDIDALQAAIAGADYVLSGCAVTAQGTPDMTVAVAKGAVMSNSVMLPVTAGNATITTAHATLPRIDLVVVNSSGTKAVRAGTAATNPKPPNRTANDVILAQVFIPAADTTIAANQIVDKRCGGSAGPITVKKTTAAVTFNTTASIQTYFTITLPSGLFLSGKVLHVRCGGTYLLNSGTPTMTLTIAYGGTTMFADVSIAGAADADRGGWHLDFDLIAQANNDQALNGFITYQNTVSAGRVAPTTGVGDLLGSVAVAGRPVTTPINGAAAVDSDAGDRTLTVQWTMSVNNAADEITMEYGVAELS